MVKGIQFAKFTNHNLITMRKETGILLAGSLGIIIGLGIFGVRKFLLKKSREYNDYYSDFHRHFEKKQKEENHDGVEFLAMR